MIIFLVDSIYIRQAFGVIIGYEIKTLCFINLRVTSLLFYLARLMTMKDAFKKIIFFDKSQLMVFFLLP